MTPRKQPNAMKVLTFIRDRLCEKSTYIGIAKLVGTYFVYRTVRLDPQHADSNLKAAIELLSYIVALGGAWNVIKPEPPKAIIVEEPKP